MAQLKRQLAQIQVLEKEIAEQRLTTLLWRDKCHEILDAVELANVHSSYENHYNFLPRHRSMPQGAITYPEKGKSRHFRKSEMLKSEKIPPFSTVINSRDETVATLLENSCIENDEYSERLISSNMNQQTPCKYDHQEPGNDNLVILPYPDTHLSPERGRKPHRYSQHDRESSESASPHPIERTDRGLWPSLDENSRIEQKEKETPPKKRLVSPPPRTGSQDLAKGNVASRSSKKSPQGSRNSRKNGTKETNIFRSPTVKSEKGVAINHERASSPKQWNPFFNKNISIPRSPSVYDVALQNTKVTVNPKKPISPIYKIHQSDISETLKSELPNEPPKEV